MNFFVKMEKKDNTVGDI